MSYYQNRNRGYNRFSRGRYQRRGGVRRRGFRNRTQGTRDNFTYGNVLDKVVRDVSRLSGLINTEFKKIDTVNDSTIPSTGFIRLINASVVGDDFTNRDGRQIRIKSCGVTFTMIMDSVPLDSQLRCMVVIDKQPNGILMTIAQLLDTSTVSSFKNLDNRKRFVILKDEVLTLSQSGENNTHLKWYKKIDMKTVYDSSNTGSISDITTNALYLVMISNDTPTGPRVICNTRVRFIDN